MSASAAPRSVRKTHYNTPFALSRISWSIGEMRKPMGAGSGNRLAVDPERAQLADSLGREIGDSPPCQAAHVVGRHPERAQVAKSRRIEAREARGEQPVRIVRRDADGLQFGDLLEPERCAQPSFHRADVFGIDAYRPETARDRRRSNGRRRRVVTRERKPP